MQQLRILVSLVLASMVLAEFGIAGSGESYRTLTSGNWDGASTWESSSMTHGWMPAPPPSGGEASILVQSGHVVTITSSINISNTVVDGQLIVNAPCVLTATATMPSLIEKAGLLKIAGTPGLTLNGTLTVKGSLSGTSTDFLFSVGSAVVYCGPTGQTLSSLGYQGLVINNAAGVHLSTDVSVSGALTIVCGNLNTDSNTLNLLSGATLSEAAPYSVVGLLHTSAPCIMSGTQSFGGVGIEITIHGGPYPTVFDIVRHTGVAPSLGVGTAVLRSFDVTPRSGPGFNATLVFHYALNELNGRDESSLQLFRSTDGSAWSSVGGTANTSAHTVTVGGINSFSSWTVGQPVPIPALSTIAPSGGSRGTTLDVVITGTGFSAEGSSVSFSGRGITTNSVTVASTTQLTANITIDPTTPVGFQDVSVTTSFGTRTLSNGFQVTNPLPLVTGISPPDGAAGQTITVMVTGSGFINGTTAVSLGSGVTVNSVTVNDFRSLTARISIAADAAVGTRTVTVSNPAPGGGSTSLVSGFTVALPVPVPTLVSLAPTSGARGQAYRVTLTGTNFLDGATVVNLGADIVVDSVVILSSTQMQIRASIAYAASSGARDVSVTNVGPGGGTATIVGGFNVTNPLAVITGLSAASGTRGRTASLALTGSGFISGVTSVNLGSAISVTSITVLSPTQLQASLVISRGASVGLRDVTVTNSNPGGGSSALSGSFDVQNPDPVVSTVTPNVGVVGQTLSGVVITGADFFAGVTSVSFGSGLVVGPMTVDSSGTHIIASISIAAATVAGERGVTVTNPGPGGGSSILSSGFTVWNPVPTLAGISPASGARSQTLNLSISGANFISGTTSAALGVGTLVNSVTVNSPTSMTANITILADAIPGARSLVVTNPSPGGGSATLPFVFNIDNPRPTLSSVSPPFGACGASMLVTLGGSSFVPLSTTVSFGAGITVNSVTVSSGTQLVASVTIATTASLGTRDVTVTNPIPGGGNSTLLAAFSVQYPQPTLGTLLPSTGTRGQTLDVGLAGANFLSGITSFSFGPGININSLTVTNTSAAIANLTITPAATTGARDVSVTNPSPGGGTGILSGAFVVANPAPTILSVTPSSAARGSVVTVTIIGSQCLSGVTSISFGDDIAVTNVVMKSINEIQASLAIGVGAAIGSRAVTLTNPTPGGGSALLPTGFTVIAGPATSVDGSLGVVPDQYVLQEAYPNPFNPSTRIRYGLPEASRVHLDVHNMIGNVVAELVDGERSRGMYELQWHADNLPSGVYLVRLQAESLESSRRIIASRKLVLVK